MRSSRPSVLHGLFDTLFDNQRLDSQQLMIPLRPISKIHPIIFLIRFELIAHPLTARLESPLTNLMDSL
jgi:hypothetical protein